MSVQHTVDADHCRDLAAESSRAFSIVRCDTPNVTPDETARVVQIRCARDPCEPQADAPRGIAVTIESAAVTPGAIEISVHRPRTRPDVTTVRSPQIVERGEVPTHLRDDAAAGIWGGVAARRNGWVLRRYCAPG